MANGEQNWTDSTAPYVMHQHLTNMPARSWFKRNSILRSLLRSLLTLIIIAVAMLILKRQHDFQSSYYLESSLSIVHAAPAITAAIAPPSIATNAGGGTGDDAFDNVFKLTQRSEKWRLWDARRQTALARDDVECIWTDFKPYSSLTSENQTSFSRICTYPIQTDKFVSGKLRRIGRFEDCDDLPRLWREATVKWGGDTEGDSAQQRALLASANKTSMIYLDVGGNIGSCVMEMLHSTNAKIVVFEPHPHNLAQITTTLSGLAERLRHRVVVFPIGVGDVTGNFTMHMASNNRGNSVVGQVIKDNPSQQFLNATSIFVEQLNDIFNTDQVVIPLMKMDIQGFECRAWDGMSSLLPSIEIIKTEAERIFLVGQGCSPQELREKISKAGFTLKGKLNIIAKRNPI